jgi:hypothetical protein
MSIFSNILDKLGIKKKDEKDPNAEAALASAAASAAAAAAAQAKAKEEPAKPTSPKPVAPAAVRPQAPTGVPPIGHGAVPPVQAPRPTVATSVSIEQAAATAAAAVKPVEMPMVDVTAKLDGLAKAFSVPLNWRQSINDLMALLGLPHTPQDIKDLAVELGCPEKEMADSYSRNVWTHKTLLKKIAENGGNIPKELLD